jgi:hypothetical protein
LLQIVPIRKHSCYTEWDRMERVYSWHCYNLLLVKLIHPQKACINWKTISIELPNYMESGSIFVVTFSIPGWIKQRFLRSWQADLI